MAHKAAATAISHRVVESRVRHPALPGEKNGRGADRHQGGQRDESGSGQSVRPAGGGIGGGQPGQRPGGHRHHDERPGQRADQRGPGGQDRRRAPTMAAGRPAGAQAERFAGQERQLADGALHHRAHREHQGRGPASHAEVGDREAVEGEGGDGRGDDRDQSHAGEAGQGGEQHAVVERPVAAEPLAVPDGQAVRPEAGHPVELGWHVDAPPAQELADRDSGRGQQWGGSRSPDLRPGRPVADRPRGGRGRCLQGGYWHGLAPGIRTNICPITGL